MQNFNETQLESILLEAGFLDFDKLEKIKAIQNETGEKIEKILLSEEIINYKELLELLAAKMGVDFVDLEEINVNKDALLKVTSEIAKKYLIFPFEIRNNHLYLAMQNPDDIFLIDEIKVFIQMEIKPFLADSRLIGKAIGYFYPEAGKSQAASPKEEQRKEKIKESLSKINKPADIKTERAEKPEQGASSDLHGTIKRLLNKASIINANDIHFDTIKDKTRIRYRVEGCLRNDDVFEIEDIKSLVQKLKSAAGIKQEVSEALQKGFFSYDFDVLERLSVEVLVLPVVNGEKLLLKLERIEPDFKLENIGLTKFEIGEVERLLSKKSGLILITGQKASGRTTTFYTMLKKKATNDMNIITIEDSVTKNIEAANQIQIKNKEIGAIVDLLKSVPEFDPDAIFVDIERSGDVLGLLADIAHTGKLVIATACFSDSAEALKGMVEAGIDQNIIARSLEGILAQTVVKKLCPVCKESWCGSDVEKSSVRECYMCDNTGYWGKQTVFELLVMNNEIKEWITKDMDIDAICENMEFTGSSFKKNCMNLVDEGITSIEEINKIGY